MLIQSPDYRMQRTTADDTTSAQLRRRNTPRSRFIANTSNQTQNTTETVGESLFDALKPTTTARTITTGAGTTYNRTSPASTGISSYRTNEQYFSENRKTVSVLSNTTRSNALSTQTTTGISNLLTGQNTSTATTAFNPTSLMEEGFQSALSSNQKTGTNSLISTGASLYSKIGSKILSASSFFTTA